MTEGMGDETTMAQPIRRFGEPEEVTKLSMFMAREAAYSTSSEWVVDGGPVFGPVVDLPEE
jgi:3alpha(or 20beta)-hydroxysteroid dehydrogenase